MTDEIREILDILKNCKDYDDEVFLIKQHSATLLLDYITNLQQQLHQASLDIQELTERDIECPSWCDKLTNLQQEIKEANDSITWWTNRFKAVERDNRKLQQRIAGLEAENETLRSDFKNQVEYTNKIAEENERLNKRNEEIYKGYRAVVDELTEYAEENERLKEELFKSVNNTNNSMELTENYKSRCEKAKNKLSFIDEALENDILNVPLCITKINSALNILQGENNGN